MGLSMGNGPLAQQAADATNLRIDGPERLLFFDDFPRRVRGVFAGTTVLDTTRGRLLHESGLLPVLYVPETDVDSATLRRSEHTTFCPYKGEAGFWTVEVGERTAEDAVWSYDDPIGPARWLRGYRSVAWAAMDVWYDEEEPVFGHLRDPYHRVDVRAASGRVRVMAGADLLADSTRAKVLSETGLPNHYYLPRHDVRVGLFSSETSAVCPYKGISSYWSTATLEDAAWSYDEPLEDATKVAGHVCFVHDDLTTLVD